MLVEDLKLIVGTKISTFSHYDHQRAILSPKSYTILIFEGLPNPKRNPNQRQT